MSVVFSPALGDRIAGRFELKAPLRGGGVVRTFLAADQQTGRDIAISLIDPACAHSNAWAGFVRVVAAAAAAAVPGLVLPLGVPATPPTPPYCVADPQVARGLDRLREQEGALPWERALALGERISEILQRVVAATGVAHRALLPSRCVVTAREDVEVLDYGIAELELAVGRTDDSGYRAPEQSSGAGDQRSDVFTLAVILFELISGQRPPTTTTRLRSLVPVPLAVDGFLARALAVDPSQRHADLEVMRAQLRELIGLPAIDRVVEPAAPPEPPPVKVVTPAELLPLPSATPEPPESTEALPVAAPRPRQAAPVQPVRAPAPVQPVRAAATPEPPIERAARLGPVAAAAVRARREQSEKRVAASADELPALKLGPVTPTELAPVVARPTAAPASDDRTEALPRVRRAPPVDATEVLAKNVAREAPAEATVSQMRPTEIDDEVMAPAQALRISPRAAPAPVAPVAARVSQPPAAVLDGAPQRRLLIVNLAIVGLIVLGLMITAMLR